LVQYIKKLILYQVQLYRNLHKHSTRPSSLPCNSA